MALRTGDTLGAYEILEPIGRGGMGEVFRARDPRMGRDVAIKISLDEFPERFAREVHAIAALNHPNVCTIYDVGPNYLVMELVEGPTLAERIAEAPLPLPEALRIGRQIADALEAAHERGIVHRDLKPGNIKLTANGTVKVLDFGLAKLGGTPVTASDHSPTLSMQATQAGVVLGTAAYMAPEQARGKAVDSRADVWAFGVVVYEMTTGKRLFQGEDLTDTLASVVKVDPDLGAAPPELRRLLRKCLAKDPVKRLRHIGDVWELLEEPRGATRRSAIARVAPWAAVGVLAAALVALGAVHFTEQAPDAPTVQFALDAPPDTTFANIYGGYAPSPDGQYIVFVAASAQTAGPMLWLRRLDSVTAQPLPGTERGNFPTWGPDSRSIVFFADDTLKRLDLSGGAPLTLTQAANDAVSPTGAWNRDGVILFGSRAGLMRVSSAGGGATLLTAATGSETGHGYPQFLPDGRRFLYFVSSTEPDVQGVYASSLDEPTRREQLVRAASKAIFVPARGEGPGHLLWMEGETLVAQPFEPDSLRRSGDLVSVAEDVGLNPGMPIRAAFWASEAGLLTYFAAPPGVTRRIVWINRDGKELGDALPADTHLMPALSPDGARLAVSRRVAGEAGDIYVWDFERKTMPRLTFEPGVDSWPVWSPDGRQLAYLSARGGVRQMYRKDASGAGEEELIVDAREAMPLDWSSDSEYLLYRQRNADTNWDIMAVPMSGPGKPFAVVQTRFVENVGRLSPNRRWIAYTSNESGREELYIQSFAPPGSERLPGKWQISNTGASDPSWRRDGRELYYETPSGQVMAVDIREDAEGIQASASRQLFSAALETAAPHSLAAASDGQRFVAVLSEAPSTSPTLLTVVANWKPARR